MQIQELLTPESIELNFAPPPDTVWQALIAPYRRYHEFFKAMLQQGITEGTLKGYDPDLAAHVVVALAVGLLLQGILDPQDADWAQLPGESMKILLDGLAQKDGPAIKEEKNK